MRIARHRLLNDDGDAVPYVPSPNTGEEMEPRYLVLHFTAGRTADESVRWLSNRQAKASAHLVIARDGSVTQLVPFNRVAWHAGVSKWEGLVGLNRHSIGIELDNAGRLERKGQRWCAWFGDAFPDDQVMQATHKHESGACGWHVYTPAQISATLEAAGAIVDRYGLRDVVGHEDIAPGRKCDPGPAFPLGNLRARLFGRAEEETPLFETTAALNIRRGPGTQHERLEMSPLPEGTPLEVLGEEGSWRLVNVVGGVGDTVDVQGWVHGGFIRRR